MKIQQQIVIAIVSLFAASIAPAQYYYAPPPGYAPPPPAYAPPPPGYGPPPPYWAPWPVDTGPYVRFGLGPAFYQSGNLKGYSFAPFGALPGFTGPTGTIHYDVGVSADFGIGWAFNKYVSLGFQTGYTWAGIDSVDNYFSDSASLGNVPFLANLTLSCPIPHTNIIPYIGGGVGGSDSIFDVNSFTPIVGSTSANTIFGSQSDVVFAWQASAGVRFKLNPNMSVGVGYEYFATGDPTFSYPPSPNLNVVFQGVRTHSVLFVFQANF